MATMIRHGHPQGRSTITMITRFDLFVHLVSIWRWFRRISKGASITPVVVAAARNTRLNGTRRDPLHSATTADFQMYRGGCDLRGRGSSGWPLLARVQAAHRLLSGALPPASSCLGVMPTFLTRPVSPTRRTVQRHGRTDGVASHQPGVLYVTVLPVPSTLGPHNSARRRPCPSCNALHSPARACLAITDEASPFALRSTEIV
jgi:hypothetical protein